jgi:hypothetical protein
LFLSHNAYNTLKQDTVNLLNITKRNKKMTIHASGTPIKMSEIVAEFTANTGKNMSSMRSRTWYTDDSITIGNFPTTNISFSSMYSKRATDPAGNGNWVNGPGDYTFVIPLYRNNINFYAWGGGGGSLAGGDGGTSTVTLPATTLTANGGQQGGAGGYRYVGPPGAGGGHSGGSFGEDGQGGSGDFRGPGGNAGGTSYGGGAGGTNPGANYTAFPGNAPGGGGSGSFGYDGSHDPAFSGGGGAGGSGFAGVTYNSGQLTSGTSVNIHIASAGGNGGNGQVKITWS